ncbi:GH15 family glucan-1,4-alpha-glucosidase [Pseudarthrobacter defluvii]|nr:GH15 family glucan-1,4-alpha-glucosidase [Pseudarthrobacter defluvii]
MQQRFDSELNSFVQSHGSKGLDASMLLIPRVRFPPPVPPHALGTVDGIQRNLTQDGFVLRYKPERSNDGLPGGEGVFLACSFWLVDAILGAGRSTEATELVERLLALRNDLGLLSEEWDGQAAWQLGNTPKAFSHFALISSAFGLQHVSPCAEVTKHASYPAFSGANFGVPIVCRQACLTLAMRG